MNKSLNLIIFFSIFSILSIHSQLLNIKLKEDIKNEELVTHISRSTDTAESNKTTWSNAPKLNHAPFSTTKEISETAARNSISTNSEYPTFKNLTQVAANNRSNYVHPETNTVFPYQIGDLDRVQIIISKEQSQKISAVYKSSKSKSELTISMIPASEATEGRLRNEYLTNIKQLSKDLGKTYLPKPVFLKFKGYRYTNNGVEGTYVNDEKSFSQIIVFECGSWILVSKLNLNGIDEEHFSKFSEDLIRYFNPSKLTSLRPMNLKPIVDFDRESMKDTVVTGALVGSAFKKVNWATENVNDNERYSGFPDIYLKMHTESLQEYLNILGRKNARSKNPENFRFYIDLKSINDAGYLAEFIVEAYENVMIVPNYLNLDFVGYTNWKRDRELNVDLLKKRYKINYRALPY